MTWLTWVDEVSAAVAGASPNERYSETRAALAVVVKRLRERAAEHKKAADKHWKRFDETNHNERRIAAFQRDDLANECNAIADEIEAELRGVTNG